MPTDPIGAAADAAWEAKKAALLDHVTEPAQLRTLVGVFREISSLKAEARRTENLRTEATARHQRITARQDATIAALQARIAALEAALRPFAGDLEGWEKRITVKHVRRARALLGG